MSPTLKNLEFRRLFETAPSLIVVLDPDCNILAASDLYLKATCKTREQIVGKNIFAVFKGNPDDTAADAAEVMRASIERVKKTKDADRMPFQRHDIERTKAQGGGYEERFWSPMNSPILSATGEVEFIVHRVEDVTAMVKESERVLQAEQQLSRFFTHSLDMLCIADQSGYFKNLNPAFETTLGFSLDEMCTKPIIDFIHPDDIQPTLDAIARQQGGQAILSFENRYKTKDGSYKWLSWKSVPEGKLMYAVARDVTELKKIEKELVAAREAALEASRLKSEFLANMSHEIRTPINGVVGMTDLVLDSELTVQQREYVESIQSSADALLTVINDILDFSKIEAGKLDLEEVNFDLNQVIRDIERSFSLLTKSKGLSFTIKNSIPASSYFKGDPGRLRQVINNLLSNAIKFTTEGSITLEISRNHQGLIRFAVIDTGIGISAKSLPTLFQAFSQADSSTTRKFGGTGLGLSISKRLVEMMKGQIGASSREGVGSTFWFEVNLTKGPWQSLQNDHADEEKLMSAVKAVTGARILIAEDNIINQKVALSILQKMGYRANAVANGLEVLEALKVIPYDLVLMDCQMPEMDGYEATRKIRQILDPKIAKIPIIAMTANAIKGDKEKCLSSGMNDYLAKPVKPVLLAKILETWLKPIAKEAERRGVSEKAFADVLDQECLEAIRDLDEGNPELVNEIVAVFNETAPQKIAQMQSAIASGNVKAMKFEAHSIKSTSGYLGANTFSQICRQIEDLKSLKNKNEATQLVKELELEFTRVKAALEHFLKNFNNAA